MASGFSGVDLGQLGVLYEFGTVAAMSDAELVERFASSQDARSELAFAALVARHGPMVLGVCRRILRGDDSGAEDAFQATFLVLARRAGKLAVRESLGPWLYGVSRRVAGRARTARGRPCLQATAVEVPSASSPDAAEIAELRGVLDEEVGRLPGRLRESVILCLFEDLTLKEAATRMGCADGTAGSRLSRARELLRSRLARRGFSPAILGLEPSSLRVTVPKALIESATSMATGRLPGTILTTIGQLAHFALREMMMTKILAATLLVAGCLTAAGAIFGATRPVPPAAPSGPPEAALIPRADNPPQTPLAAPSPTVPARTIRVVVLDPRGKPAPEAKVLASIWTHEKGFKATRDYQTDASGAVQVELPASFYIVRLWAFKEPMVSMFAAWEQAELTTGRGLPAEYTFALEAGVASGGRVTDAQGKPVAGARVQVKLSDAGKVAPVRGDGRVRYNDWLAEGEDAVTTDADGRWRINNVPDRPGVDLGLMVSHPDFVSDKYWEGIQKDAGVTTAMLRRESATLALSRGVIVEGQVTGPDGKPVGEGLIIHGDDPYFASAKCDFPIGPDGRYRLPALPTGETRLTVIVPGFAPQTRPVKLEAGLPPQDFRLEPGKTIRLQIVDPAGKPVPRVTVQVAGWMGRKALHNHDHPNVRNTKIPRRADESGVWEWTWAPEAPVKLEVSHIGDAVVPLELGGGEPALTVVLKSEHRVTGRVTDATTGQPIPSFAVIPVDVFRKDFLNVERGKGERGKDGRLRYLATRTDIALRLRVEAMGYRSQNGPEFRVGDDSARTQDFSLQPSRPIEGVVTDDLGHPVTNAEVLLATPTQDAQSSDDWGNCKASTDSAGRFTFPDPGESWAVMARGEAGFALAEFPIDHHDAGTLRLQPWASVRGRFRDGGRPVRNARVLLEPIRIDNLTRPRVDARYQASTDADGRFEFPKVPPVPVLVRVLIGPWQDEVFRSGPSVPLDLRPRAQVELDLGGPGAVLTGKVNLTGPVPPDLDCTYSLNRLIRLERGIAVPAVAGLGFDARNGWRENWTKTSEGQAYLGTLRNWFVKLAPDGSFRVDGMPPGDYDLAVEVYAKPNGCLVDPLARSLTRVVVTAADVDRGTLAVPGIATRVAPSPAVGEAPTIAFRGAEGPDGTLEDVRGRTVIVHFWASWCGPCKQQLPALRRVHDRFAPLGLSVLSLSLDEDAAAWMAALKGLDMPWRQGRLAANEVGVSSVPVYWLLDPAGKIVAKSNDLDVLAALLAERLK